MPPLSSTPLHPPLDALNYRRRCTCSVSIGTVPLGSEYPLRIQTMANVSTPDTEAGIAQTERVALAGADYMRFTAQGVREAECLQTIRATLDKKGYSIPLIADIHFNPQAAYEALKHVEKVRINPGNFADRKGEWSGESISDADFAHGQERVQQLFGDFLREAKRLKRAIRLGVNHGSLSERMLRRYGDTPEGMVESCLEYLRVARSLDFEDIVISMKSSNVQVMTQAVRLLVERMDEMGVHYPLH
ncbi:flavodoxin-dependent (E)-4-hydroxy-3-methylbut-2-enyl-diphosphate synthase, partial [Porphyromonas endodontalis]